MLRAKAVGNYRGHAAGSTQIEPVGLGVAAVRAGENLLRQL